AMFDDAPQTRYEHFLRHISDPLRIAIRRKGPCRPSRLRLYLRGIARCMVHQLKLLAHCCPPRCGVDSFELGRLLWSAPQLGASLSLAGIKSWLRNAGRLPFFVAGRA